MGGEMTQNDTKLTARQEMAALEVALDQKTDEQIAEGLKISRSSLVRWKRLPYFVARVEALRTAFGRAVEGRGIADSQARAAKIQGLYERMELIVEERAKELESVPGGASGLLVRQYKQVGRDDYREEYHFDAALEREMRAALEQAALESGDRKKAAGTKDDPVHQVSLSLEEWKAQAAERKAEAAATMALFEDEGSQGKT